MSNILQPEKSTSNSGFETQCFNVPFVPGLTPATLATFWPRNPRTQIPYFLEVDGRTTAYALSYSESTPPAPGTTAITGHTNFYWVPINYSSLSAAANIVTFIQSGEPAYSLLLNLSQLNANRAHLARDLDGHLLVAGDPESSFAFPEYADDTAAISGGLAPEQIYRTAAGVLHAVVP